MARLRSLALVLAAAATVLSGLVAADIGASIENDGIGLDRIQYGENQTVLSGAHPLGWHSPKGVCSGRYCVYSNRQIANRRGIVVISVSQIREKIETLKSMMSQPGHNENAEPFPFDTTEDPKTGLTLVASKKVRRGTPIMAWTPTFLIHREFFDDEPVEAQERLLDVALQLLPEATRQKVNSYRQLADGTLRPLREVVRSRPFEINLSNPFDRAQSEKHLAFYPEAVIMQHDCRPNVAFYTDPALAGRFTVARKIEAGEAVTIGLLDPMLPRAVRQELSHRLRGTNCTCSHCNAGGNLMGVTKAEERLREIKSLEELLKDPRTQGVTSKMVDRYLKLYEDDKLHSRFMEAYWTAAINYNNLGYEKRALKYVNMAIQAAIIELGKDANDIIAMRIMVNDPKGHYSWQARIKGPGQ